MSGTGSTSLRTGLVRGLQVFLPILLSGGLLYLIGKAVDLPRATEQLLGIPPWYVAAALAGVMLNILMSSWRYQLIILNQTGKKPAISAVLTINWLSFFLSQILPAAVLADILRSAASWRLLKLSPSDALATVFYDRLLALSGAIVCVALTLPFLAILRTQTPVLAAAVVAVLGCLGIAVIGTVFRLAERRLTTPSSRVVVFLTRFITGLASNMSNRGQIVTQLGIAVASMSAFAFQFWMLALGIGIQIPFGTAAVFSPLIYLAQVVPLLYSGFGLREGVAIAIVSGGGWASPEAAMALGLAIGVTNIVAALPGAFAIGLVLGGDRRD